MSLPNALHGILQKIVSRDDVVFSADVEEQKRFLERLPEPADDIQRAYNQYLCQMHLIKSPFVRFLMNLASLPLIPVFLLKKTDKPSGNEEYDAVFFADGKPDNILPLSLSEGKTIKIIREKKTLRDPKMKEVLRAVVKRHPFSWQFILKILIKLEYFCHVIHEYKPKIIISCNEYSFTSSVLTLYCEMCGVLHFNVMHGEKLYLIRDSFFRFDKCFVWDKYYADLFTQLRAEKTQFEIEIPPSLIICGPRDPKVDYTYYLGDENGTAIETIIENLRKLGEKKYRVRIRPHPRYTDAETIKKIEAAGIAVEDTAATDISGSLSSTQYAISLYSTVLNQAVNNGIGAVIDDLSNEEKYRRLKALKYILLEDKRVKRLSEIIV